MSEPEATPPAPKTPSLLKPLASLRLTVVLFALSLLLIFASTLAQTRLGIWAVMEQYYKVWITWIDFRLFLPAQADVPGGFPFPGGLTLGVLILINLLAAHTVRFKLKAKGGQLALGSLITLAGLALVLASLIWPDRATLLTTGSPMQLTAVWLAFLTPLVAGCWLLFGKRLGIVLVHGSLILLIAGEGVALFQKLETQMVIYEGHSTTHAYNPHEAELAIVDRSDPAFDHVAVIREAALIDAWVTGEPIDDPALPFVVFVQAYFEHSELMRIGPMMDIPLQADRGLGLEAVAREAAPASGANSDIPSASVRLVSREGVALGQYLVSMWFLEDRGIVTYQPVSLGEATYDLALRSRRYEKPYRVELLDFRHDVYPGTDVAKNFSSDVVVTDAATGETLSAHIRMNAPLRHQGETFFQADWIRPDRGTVLQIVRNPGWALPYKACMIGGAGLAIHFLFSLTTFLRKRSKQAAKRNASGEVQAVPALVRWLPRATAALALLIVIYAAVKPMTQQSVGRFNLTGLGQLTVAADGRFKPFQAYAQDTLSALSGRAEIELSEDRTIDATRWAVESITGPGADDYPVFRIDHPDIKTLIGIEDHSRKRFSLNEIIPHAQAINDEATFVNRVPADQRDPYQRGVLKLVRGLNLFFELRRQNSFGILPTDTPEVWLSRVDAQEQGLAPTPNSLQGAWLQLFGAYANDNPAGFNEAVSWIDAEQRATVPELVSKSEVEWWFNGFKPFKNTMVLYVLAGLLVFGSWLAWPQGLVRAAFGIMIVAALLHTLGLILRIYISGRPPVTNLYSSAVFIGWGIVLMGMLLEPLLKQGLGLIVGAACGFATLLVAGGLGADGDTMAVLQAVLDTNFWLATHVITITFGYSATFVAGFLGLLYIFMGVFTKNLTPDTHKALGRAIYGIVCFALLLSFVGTILGGIWADQSWGRFWGWDPKENGALMIVIWNALILHARWGGIVRERGVAMLAVLGNVVTAWSWFGTNLLGAGLHAYGFIDNGWLYLLGFALSQAIVFAIATLPTTEWRSFRQPT